MRVRTSGLLVLVTAALLACAPAPAAAPAPAPGARPASAEGGRRAIIVSFDALSERRLFDTVDSTEVPALRALFTSGACAASARPAFPSLTAPGHAAIWTGAYGDVNGIASNSQPMLPRDAHSLGETVSGFSSASLRAESIWLTAVSSGLRVFAHHPTQAPEAPGYPPLHSGDRSLDGMREAARALLARDDIQVVNGYNLTVSGTVVLTERQAPPRTPVGWRNLDRLQSGVAPREIAWVVGEDSIFALLHGGTTYDRVLVTRERDAASGVTANAAPVEQAPLRGRPLARHFSEPLEIPLPDRGGRGYVRVRLFDVAPDAARYLLLMPEVQVVQGNRPEVAAAYDAVVRGWVGNSAAQLTERGELGTPLVDGGDGTAELRWLETAELLARQFMRGAAWAWETHRPALLLDYYPGIDEADHSLYGLVSPHAPGYDADVARRVNAMRSRAWGLADLRVQQLRELVAGDPNAALFVSGDHGMRAVWRTFRPNIALAQAGLLAADDSGAVDLSRTLALSPASSSYQVILNRTAWKDGIVPPEREADVLRRVEAALLGARGSDGAPIVTRVWRAAEHDSLGIGGPVGGDLYFEVAPGYSWSPDARPARSVTSSADRRGAHGFPSTAVDMQTVFCAVGDGIAPTRFGAARTIDVAPTVAAWLGIRPPAQAVGRSWLSELVRSTR